MSTDRAWTRTERCARIGELVTMELGKPCPECGEPRYHGTWEDALRAAHMAGEERVRELAKVVLVPLRRAIEPSAAAGYAEAAETIAIIDNLIQEMAEPFSTKMGE